MHAGSLCLLLRSTWSYRGAMDMTRCPAAARARGSPSHTAPRPPVTDHGATWRHGKGNQHLIHVLLDDGKSRSSYSCLSRNMSSTLAASSR